MMGKTVYSQEWDLPVRWGRITGFILKFIPGKWVNFEYDNPSKILEGATGVEVYCKSIGNKFHMTKARYKNMSDVMPAGGKICGSGVDGNAEEQGQLVAHRIPCGVDSYHPTSQ